MKKKNKLWKDCSADEHREMKNWEQRFRYWQEQYKLKKIDTKEFGKKLDILEKELKEIEKKYD